MHFSSSDIESILGDSVRYAGNRSLAFDGFRPVLEAGKNHLSWIRPGVKKAAHYINHTKAGGIICNEEAFALFSGSPEDILFIISGNPLLTLAKILNHFERADMAKEAALIHPTAIIHRDCKLGKDVRVGAYSILEACTIGAGTVIENNVKIFGNASIGEGCHVREFCTIGGAGFGIAKDDAGRNIAVPHVGGTVIGNRVSIFPFVNIDRGMLGNTVVEDHVMIDHHCHVAHNTHTGSNTIITAGSILGGGCKVMNDCFLGLNCIIREKIEVGAFVTIGMGAIITKNIPDHGTWVGNPATELEAFVRQREFLKRNAG